MEGGVDDADDWAVAEEEGDRDAEHGKNVRVVYGSWLVLLTRLDGGCEGGYDTVQRIDAPSRLIVD